MRTFTLFAILLFSVAVCAAEPSVFDSPPGTKLMPAKKVKLVLEHGKYTELDYPARPCVMNDTINLALGEKIYIEAEVKDDMLVNLKHVDSIEHPECTMELEFSQSEDSTPPFMMLHITNPFKKDLKYESSVLYYGQYKLRKTSNVGVGAERATYESWPSSITQIVLKNFELVEQGHRYTPE
ncbi:MAG: hypothetical protein HZA22_03205 [Nitrospirae bacterium]|nr:hypothetical protein [Nitrospirota bacterium]